MQDNTVVQLHRDRVVGEQFGDHTDLTLTCLRIAYGDHDIPNRKGLFFHIFQCISVQENLASQRTQFILHRAHVIPLYMYFFTLSKDLIARL
ncbi:hypothetical protein SDC9_147751 [bioreactor metagenome]|uniref:Uncharacterized protein n=1 Tax=bioreactor metagenome TaxID=1076179 RepID=A0A645EET2_9ZZZZ